MQLTREALAMRGAAPSERRPWAVGGQHGRPVRRQRLCPGWFGWAIPLGADRLRIGVGTTGCAAPADLLAAMRLAFPAMLPDAPEPGSYSAGLIPLWEPGAATADHVMLVGDAAW